MHYKQAEHAIHTLAGVVEQQSRETKDSSARPKRTCGEIDVDIHESAGPETLSANDELEIGTRRRMGESHARLPLGVQKWVTQFDDHDHRKSETMEDTFDSASEGASDNQIRLVSCAAAFLQENLETAAKAWREVALVNKDRVARVRRYPSRRYRAEVRFLVPSYRALGVKPIDRPFPLSDQAPRTDEPYEPVPPPKELVKDIEENLQTFEQCISEGAFKRLKEAERRSSRDEAEATNGSLTFHRQRSRLGKRKSEVRIGPSEYHPVVNKVLQGGYTLEIPDEGPPRIRHVAPLGLERWGFDAEALRMDGETIAWRDRELLGFLKWGFSDYSGKTPPIASFS